jgi:hypothetical protein
VLALNLEGIIDPDMPIIETIKRIHRQKGLVIVVHPSFDTRRNSVSFRTIERIINSEDPELYLDGIEIYNAGHERLCQLDILNLVFRNELPQIIKFVQQNIDNPKLGALLGGSDGHTRRIGEAVTQYSHQSVLTDIVNRETSVVAANSTFSNDSLDTVVFIYAMIRGHLNGNV